MTREAKIAACPVPEHADAGVSIISVWGGGYSVQCNKDKGLCWSGPRCKTPAEAIARWNEVVGAKRLRDTLTDMEMDRLEAQLADERKHADALAEAVNLECEDRKRLQLTFAELSRTVAPLLAVFRDGLGGTVSEEQVEVAVAAMGAVQRAEMAMGASWFDKSDALSAHRERRAAGEKEERNG